MASTVFQGSCACERITYKSLAAPKHDGSTVCHCTTCRKVSGGPFQVYTDVPSKEVIWFDNTERLRYEGLPIKSAGGIRVLRLSTFADRASCESCGSWLAMRYDADPGETSITLGTVDMSSVTSDFIRQQLTTSREIFCASRTAWLQAAAPDKLFDGLPPGFDPAPPAPAS